MTYTVILLRGSKPDVVKHDLTEGRAYQRADSLLDLHGLTTGMLTYNFETKTFTVDASAYYSEKKDD